MIRRNPIPRGGVSGGFCCSAGDCVRPGRCCVFDPDGVGVWYCLDHLALAVSFHERHKLEAVNV